jgi:hypothetical protein
MSNLLQSETKLSTRSNISQDTIMHGRLAHGQWINRESLRMRHGKKPGCDHLDQRPPVAGALIADPVARLRRPTRATKNPSCRP